MDQALCLQSLKPVLTLIVEIFVYKAVWVIMAAARMRGVLRLAVDIRQK